MPDSRASAPPEATLDDQVLLARVAARDVAAFGLLYDRHNRAAFALALRLLGQEGAAEDAVQRAFLVLWRQAGRVQARPIPVRIWLLTIVYQRARDAGGQLPSAGGAGRLGGML